MREYIFEELPPAYYTNNLFQYHQIKNRKPHQFTLPMLKNPYCKLLLYSFPKLWTSKNFESKALGISKQSFRKLIKA